MAPPQEVFDEIKREAINLWNTYDNTYGYAKGKIDRIKDLENVQDNAWYIVAMFDYTNQQRLLSLLLPATAEIVRDAISPINQ